MRIFKHWRRAALVVTAALIAAVSVGWKRPVRTFTPFQLVFSQTHDFTTGSIGFEAQSFPATTAAIQAAFPSATSPLMWTLNNAGSPLTEAQGGPSFTFSGTAANAHYQLATPFGSSKKAIELTDTSSTWQNASTSACDINNGAFTVIVAFRNEISVTGTQYIFSKTTAGAVGYGLFLNGNGDTLNILTFDGVHLNTFASSKTDYGHGVYHIAALTFDPTGGQSVTLRTDEESTAFSLAGYTYANLSNAAVAQISNRAGAQGFSGSVAYVACFAGTITDNQFNAFFNPNANITGGTTNLTFTPSATSATSPALTDYRNVSAPKVMKRGRVQVPLGAPAGKLGIAFVAPPLNFITQPEQIDSGSWTTNGAGLTVTGYAAEDPGYGFTATKLSKAAAGVTPSRRQTIGAQTTAGVMICSAWIWTTDALPHTAQLSCTFGGDGGGQVVNNLFTATSVPQLVVVASNPITFAAGTSFTYDIYPVNPANNADTGSVMAWGAQIAATTVIAGARNTFNAPPAYSPYSNGSTITGSITGTGATFNATNGFIEAQYVQIGGPNAPINIVAVNSGGGNGGAKLIFNSSINGLQAEIDDAGGVPLYTQNYWDYRSSNELNIRTDVFTSWDFTAGLQAPLGRVRIDADGNAPGGLTENPGFVVAWPAGINSSYTLGSSTTPNFWPNTVLERFTFGFAPGLVSHPSASAYSNQNLGVTIYKVGALGDSITGFYDGYHAILNQLLGRGRVIVDNQGWSGNVVAGAAYPNSIQSRLPSDYFVHSYNNGLVNYNDVIVYGGINDILNNNDSSATVIARLQTLYNSVAVGSTRVFGVTIGPARNNSFGSWTAGKQVNIDAVNNFIRTTPAPLSGFVDLYAFFDDGTGQYKNCSGASCIPVCAGGIFCWSYDGLHPTHGITGNPGPGSDIQGILMFEQLYANTAINPTGPAPTVASYNPNHGVAGTVVTITGTNFNNVVMVDFGDVPSQNFTVNSPTQITATVPTFFIAPAPVHVASNNGRAAGPNFTTP